MIFSDKEQNLKQSSSLLMKLDQEYNANLHQKLKQSLLIEHDLDELTIEQYNQMREKDNYLADHPDEILESLINKPDGYFFVRRVNNKIWTSPKIFYLGCGVSILGAVINQKWIHSAYRKGFFPWYDRHSPVTYVKPYERAVFFPDEISFGRSLRKLLRKNLYEIWINRDTTEVMQGCALPRTYESDTWINQRIINTYPDLPNFLSVSAYRNGKLTGGLYGILQGGIFHGESMFGLESNVTKIVFFALCQLCLENGIKIIDSQVLNDFTESLGAQVIDDDSFQVLLGKYRNIKTDPQIFSTRQFSVDPQLFRKDSFRFFFPDKQL